MKQNQLEENRTKRQLKQQLLGVLLLPVLLAATLTACKPEANAPADAKEAKASAEVNPVGTYNLVSVNGSNVPTVLQHDGHGISIASGSFVINADGTCSSKMLLSGRDTPIETKAAYTRDGTKLTMQWAGAGTTMGTLDGGSFTMNNEGMVLVYRK